MRSRNIEEEMAEDKIFLAFGSGWTALGCIDLNKEIYNIGAIYESMKVNNDCRIRWYTVFREPYMAISLKNTSISVGWQFGKNTLSKATIS